MKSLVMRILGCDGTGAELHCGQCQRALHALCLQQPCLAPSDLLEGAWDCPCCGQANSCLVHALALCHY